MERALPRIAVVAVHGVADQPQNETARRIADLLLRLNDPEVHYPAFTANPLRIPVREMSVHTSVPANRELVKGADTAIQQAVRKFDQRSDTLRLYRKELDRGGEPDAAGETPGHIYMREQLTEYRATGDDAVYETVRLIAHREVHEEAPPNPFYPDAPIGKLPRETCQVHLFEMYWADLSRAGTGVVRVIMEFYQLLFYLCGLGRKSLDFARAQYPESSHWQYFSYAQMIAEKCLVLLVPLLNLALLGLASVLLVHHLPGKWQLITGVALCGLIGAAGVGFELYRRRHRLLPGGWSVWFVGVVFAGIAGGAALLLIHPHLGLVTVLSLLVWTLGAGLYLLLMRAYEQVQLGAWVLGRCIVGALLVGWFCFLIIWPSGGEYLVVTAAMRMAEAAYAGVSVSWFLFVLFLCATSVAGYVAVKWGTPPGDRECAARAAWTANLTLLLPGLLVLLTNMALWNALALGGRKLIPTVSYQKWFLWSLPSDTTLRGAVDAMVRASATPAFAVVLCVIVVAALLLMWSILPALLSERDRAKPEPVTTAWLGRALTQSFRTMRISGELLRYTLVVALPIGLVVALWVGWAWVLQPAEEVQWIAAGMGAVLLMVVAGRGPLRGVALGFRGTLDVALDVMNWLRLHPRKNNPKARITARCTSLLRYICQWKDSRDGGGYDAIVFIAHSQGTVIVADVLRFLRVEASEPELAKLGNSLPVFFFTMGSPLRQIYSLRFPHHYGWARHHATSGMGDAPDPVDLGVKQWVNAYRSGDYVGRHLWQCDDAEATWSFERAEDARKRRLEFCIGAGGHTHYWDESAPEIARELDRLISSACGCGPSKP